MFVRRGKLVRPVFVPICHRTGPAVSITTLVLFVVTPLHVFETICSSRPGEYPGFVMFVGMVGVEPKGWQKFVGDRKGVLVKLGQTAVQFVVDTPTTVKE